MVLAQVQLVADMDGLSGRQADRVVFLRLGEGELRYCFDVFRIVVFLAGESNVGLGSREVNTYETGVYFKEIDADDNNAMVFQIDAEVLFDAVGAENAANAMLNYNDKNMFSRVATILLVPTATPVTIPSSTIA